MYLRCARATREIYLHTCNKHWHFATTHATPQVIGRSLQGPRSRLAQIDRVFLQQIERHDFEGRFMRRGEPHPGCAAGLESFLPALGAQAPAVARLQPGKTGGRDRRRQIVAGGARKRQELGIDPGADGVETDILGAGLAAACPVEPGQRFRAALAELLAENIAGFSHYLLRLWNCHSGVPQSGRPGTHVWTAPAWQGVLQLRWVWSIAVMCPACVCGRIDRWPRWVARIGSRTYSRCLSTTGFPGVSRSSVRPIAISLRSLQAPGQFVVGDKLQASFGCR